MKKTTFIALATAGLMLFTSCSKKAQVKIEKAADLEGKTIGVQVGTTGELYVQEVKDAICRSFKSGIDASMALSNGSIDAVVLDELPAKEIVKRNPNLTIVNDIFATEEYAIAVKKGNTELLESINKTILSIMSDGTYEELINTFMPVEGNIKLPATIETSGEPLRMGTNAAFPPFEYVESVEPVGFDITVSQMIARDAGRKLVVVDMSFDSLIAALQSGSVDFVAAGMTATEERKQNVDFSEPYFSSNQVIIIRNIKE